jgi:hypothetical protein
VALTSGGCGIGPSFPGNGETTEGDDERAFRLKSGSVVGEGGWDDLVVATYCEVLRVVVASLGQSSAVLSGGGPEGAPPCPEMTAIRLPSSLTLTIVP